MIRRTLAGLGVLGLAVTAALVPAPQTVAPPPSTLPPVTPEPLAIATCPWSFADGRVDSSIVLAAPGDREVTLTSPVGGVSRQVSIVGPGASVVSQTSIDAGLAPFVAEFSSVPAAVGVVASSDLQAASLTCPNVGTKLWLVAGGSTVDQRDLDLVLFNPFPEDANVELRIVSENGAEPLTELEDVSVPARSVRQIDLAALLPSRLVLAVAVDDPQGLVTPAFRSGDPELDWALWAGSSQSDRWEFPVAGIARHDATLVLVNDGPLPVAAGIDLFLPGGSVLAAADVMIEPRSLVTFDIEEEVSGLAVDADGPIGAAIVGDAFDARYGVTGVDRTASAWHLTPGAGTDQVVTVRLLNTSGAPLTVSITPVGPFGTPTDPVKVSVDPGTITDVEMPGVVAVLLESGSPFSAGWYWTRGATTAASQGVAVTP